MFRKIKDFVVKKVKGAIEWIKPKASVAVTVINALKETIESPLADFAVSLTRTQLDDKLLVIARTGLAKASEEMMLAEGIVTGSTEAVDIENHIIDYLRSKSKEARAKWYVELQGKLTVYLADGHISLQEGIALGQMIYKELHS